MKIAKHVSTTIQLHESSTSRHITQTNSNSPFLKVATINHTSRIDQGRRKPNLTTISPRQRAAPTPQWHPTSPPSSQPPPPGWPPSDKTFSPPKTMATRMMIPISAEFYEHITPRKGETSPPGYHPTQKLLLQSSSNRYTHNPTSAHATAVCKIKGQQEAVR